jgi:hypothetical protein
MIRVPRACLEWLVRRGLWTRPAYLALDVPDDPGEGEVPEGLVLREVRDGYEKWAHLLCPRCGEHIRVSLAGARRWTMRMDWLRRPSLNPSVWQTGSCGAHFFIRKGQVVWCRDRD